MGQGNGFGEVLKGAVELMKLIYGEDYFDRLAMKSPPGDKRLYQPNPYEHMQVNEPAKAH